MNILSQVIPGLRESRTPFAVGLLWVGAVWLMSYLLPDAIWNAPTIGYLSEIGDKPSILATSVALFLVYVAGIFLEIAGRAITAILLGITMPFVILAVAFYVLTGVVRSWRALAVLLLISLIAAYLRQSSVSVTSYWESWGEVVAAAFSWVVLLVIRVWTPIQEALVPEHKVFRELVEMELDKYFDEHPAFIADAARDMNWRTMRPALDATFPNEQRGRDPLIRVILLMDDFAKLPESQRQEQLHKIRRRNNRQLGLEARTDSVLDSLLRGAVTYALVSSRSCRLVFANSCLESDDLRDSLRRRIQWTTVRLKAEHESVYAEYDRVHSEGEFRNAIALPLTALISAAILRIENEASLGPGVIVYGLFAAAVIGVITFVAGQHRNRQSLALLYSCLRNNLISTAELEIPDGQLRLRRSPAVDEALLREDWRGVAPLAVAYRIWRLLRALMRLVRRKRPTADAPAPDHLAATSTSASHLPPSS